MKKTQIGGQAVIEGVMMRGKQSTAIAVRDSDGIIRLDTKRTKSLKQRGLLFRIPIIRGMLSFFLTMVEGVKIMTKSAEVFGESEPGKFEQWLSKKFKIDLMKVIVFISVILGLVVSVALFIILPNLMLKWFNIEGSNAQALAGGGFKIGILFIYLILVSFMKDIRRVFMYHGAEHKTINCYEKGLPLTVENVAKCSRIHNRCGTTFLFFVILVSIAVSLLLPIENTGLRILVRIATLPAVAGVAYELLKLLAMTNFPLFLPLKLPGYLLQAITTKKPDDKMIEVAIVSFSAVLKMDEDDTVEEVNFPLQKKYEDVRCEMEKKLKACGIDEPSDLDWILCSVLKRRRGELSKAITVSVLEYDRIVKFVDERCTNKPVQYVLSETNFYGYTLKLNSDVLIPRFETELLANEVIKNSNQNTTVLDLCCGSGAIAIAVKLEAKAKVDASDISEKALELSRENAALNNADINFIKSDMFDNINEKYDIIVSNPPYVKTDDIKTLSKEVKDFEPHLALDGGVDGLDFYRVIADRAANCLKPCGKLFLECGEGQAKEIKQMLSSRYSVKIFKDYNKIDRIIKAVKKD